MKMEKKEKRYPSTFGRIKKKKGEKAYKNKDDK